MSIKVSVIIPVYNVENYVAECIESILNQTFKEWEIVCVDDGTTDGSIKIVEKYRDTDSRIRILHQENAGLSAARNYGLRKAQGEYVLFLDSDDYLKSEALEHLYEAAVREELDELFYSASVFFESGELQEQQEKYASYYQRTGEYSKTVSGRELFIQMNEKRELKPSACLQLFRKKFLWENQLDFYEGIIHEDNLFTMKCLAFAKRASFLNEELYMRRMRNDSIMTQEKGFRNAYGYYVTIRELLYFAKEQELSKDPAYFREYQKRLCTLSDVAASYVKNFREDLPDCLDGLDSLDQCLFQLLVVNGDTVRGRIRRLEAEKGQKELAELKGSIAYRLGELLTAFPKKIKKKFT